MPPSKLCKTKGKILLIVLVSTVGTAASSSITIIDVSDAIVLVFEGIRATFMAYITYTSIKQPSKIKAHTPPNCWNNKKILTKSFISSSQA
jgi:hypothetical protein